jgi:hypothetical protein
MRFTFAGWTLELSKGLSLDIQAGRIRAMVGREEIGTPEGVRRVRALFVGSDDRRALLKGAVAFIRHETV